MVGIALFVGSMSLLSNRLALADDEPEVASPSEAYERALEHSGAGDYEAALEVIDAGLEIDADNLRLLRVRGEILMETRDFEGALAAYEAFLEAGPRGGNRRQARRIVRDLQSVKSSFLEVTVEDGPATIYLDSRALGVYCTADPVCKKGLLPGRYRLFIEVEGFEPGIERVEVKLGETTTVEPTLVERPSELTVVVDPDDAEVVVDGEPVGAGDQTLTLEPGEYEVTVSADSFVSESHEIVAARGRPVELEVALFELVPIDVAADVSADEVEILLDGEPADIEGDAIVVPPGGGAHQLTVRADGFEEQVVTLNPDRPRGQEVLVTLEPIPEPEPEPEISIEPSSSRSGMRTGATIGVAAAGALSFALAGVFTMSARSDWSDSEDHCDDDVRCNAEGYSLVRSAQAKSRRADVAMVTGGAATAAALALWFLPEQELGTGRTYTALGLGAAGAAGFALAGGFGLQAKSEWDDAQEHCDVLTACTAEGVSEVESAQSAARRANIMFAVGGVATAAALGLWLYPSSSESRPQVSAGVSPDGQGAGLSLSGSF